MKREYVLVYLGLAWLGGLALAGSVAQPTWVWLALAGLWFAGLFLARLNGWPGRAPLLCALALSLGAARFQAAQPPRGDPTFVATYNEGVEVTLEGVVIDEPDVRDQYINLRFRPETILTPESDRLPLEHGLVMVRAPRFPAYGYGDRLRVTGALETPPVFEDFSYRDYLARQGVHSHVRFGRITLIAPRQCSSIRAWSWDCNLVLQSLFDFKSEALQRLARLFPEPQASLLAGILLGVETGIPEGLKEAFSATGTTHILAISGFNVSLVAAAFAFLSERLLGRFARGRAAFVATVGIGLYTLLVGANAPVVRAAIMGSLAVLARLIGRQVFGPASLFAAAIVMTALQPLTLWDVGFQLSFMATLGLILYAEPITAALVRLLGRFTPWATKTQASKIIGEYLSLTLAAQIATLPLIAFYFRRLSPVSLAANLLILPAQPAVMVLGALAVLGGLIWLPLGTAISWLAWPFATYTIATVERLASVPGASVGLGRLSAGMLAGMYGLLFGWTWLASRKPEELPGWLQTLWQERRANVLLGVLALGAVLTWSAVLWLPDGRLHATILDVGNGEAVLVQTPSGEYLLLGGGPSANRLAEGLGRRMPFWQRRLALVVVPGSRDDQVAGLAAELPRFAVEQVVLAGQPGHSAAYRDLIDGLNRRGVLTLSADAGQEFDLGDGARLKVLAAGENGLVLRLAWGEASFLLPIGEAGEALSRLASAGEPLASTVLLLPANGGALDVSLARAISPWAAVVSVGVDGPAPETLQALREAGYTVLRTDRNGWVSFATDGQRLWAETER